MTDATVSFLALSGSVGLVAAGVVEVRRRDQRRRDCGRVELAVGFPRDLTGEQAAGLLVPIVRWPQSQLRGVSGLDAVVLEVEASADRVTHKWVAPDRRVDGIRSQAAAVAPGSRLEETASGDRPRWTSVAALRLTDWRRPLRTDDPVAVSRAVLASLRPLRTGELVRVQWQLVGASYDPPAKLRSASRRDRDRLLDQLAGRREDVDARSAGRAKQSAPLFWATLRVGAAAGSRRRATHLVARTVAALSMTGAPGVRLRRRRLPLAWVASQLSRRTTPIGAWPILINRDELVGLLGWPLQSPVIPGLSLVAGRRFAPSPTIPESGRVIARSNYPGQERLLAQAPSAALHHTWVVGPTGAGKTHLLTNLIAQDVEASRSVVVIDAKADLVDAVLDRIPRWREADVVVIDAADDRPVGVNPLAHTGQPVDVVVDQIFGVLVRLWNLQAAPRTCDLLYAALLTLAQASGMTLVELGPLLVNPRFRRELVAAVAEDPVLGPFWVGFEAMSDGERAQVVAPTLTRLRQFLLRSSLRGVLGQATPSISIGAAIDSGKIVLVSLAAGRIGSESAALLGALVLAELWLATQARVNVPPEVRRPTSVFVDEFQTISHLPTDLADVLAQSRGFGVGYTLANQSPSQQSARLREAIATNCRTKVAFATSASDAASLARDLGPDVKPDDVQELGRHEILAAIAHGAVSSPPATGATLPLAPGTGRGETIRRAASERWGQDRATIERAIRDRVNGTVEPDAPGRRRRSP